MPQVSDWCTSLRAVAHKMLRGSFKVCNEQQKEKENRKWLAIQGF